MLPSNSLDVNQNVSKHRRKHLIIGLLAIIGIVVVVILLKTPSSPLQKMIQKQTSVEIKTTYKNPFDKNTQYVNPFEKYKNPFVANR